MNTFQNRQSEIAKIEGLDGDYLLLNVYGETGIGKSRLLEEITKRLRKRPPTLVLWVDMANIDRHDAAQQILRKLIAQAEGALSGSWREIEEVAGQVTAQLTDLAAARPVYLLFDTTEDFQEDTKFWSWMEEHLVGPLVTDGQVHQVYAGRLPVPWRRIEVRRAVELLALGPLTEKESAYALAEEVLKGTNPSLQQRDIQEAVELVLEFSFGHPELTKQLSIYIAPRWPVESVAMFKLHICNEFLKPFIDKQLFEQLSDEWKKILWWISVLEWFDPTILQRYLRRTAPDLVEDKQDYFFIQGIAQLRIRDKVVWRETQGDRLHGVIREIVRHCLQVMAPEQYREALIAAAKTFDSLAGEFEKLASQYPEEYPEAEQYRQEATSYREQASMEVT